MPKREPYLRETELPSLSTIIGSLDEAQSLPLYQQLQRGLRQAIEKKLLGPDDALPPERDLAEDFSVSRITVRKALDGLVSEGLLTRKQGSGTFVSGRVEKNFSKLTSFSEDMIARGRTPHSVWLKQIERHGDAGRIDDHGSQSRNAGLSLQSSALRRRCADGARVLYGARVLPSVYRSGRVFALRRAREMPATRPTRALQRLRAVLFNAEQAELLGAKEGDAGLLVERRGFLRDGRAVEFSQSYYRGDTYDFVAELNASEQEK